MDAARTAVRIGAKEVKVVYRRSQEDMPATKLEYEDAVNERIEFNFRNVPLEYVGNEGRVTGLKVMSDDGEKIIDTDVVLVAIGSKPAKRIVSTTQGIDVDQKGYVVTREKPYGMSTLKGVFAGGDVVHQPSTVVKAMKEAKKVAEGIAAYVDAKKLLDL